ncbi:MAG: 30S ribosomal protein S8 [Dehalococcoidia bacterium]|nr:30S ribosomal protein S8 [Dehalococcoidia bacterium]
MSDPVADMLTRVRNAVEARHDAVMVPASRLKIAIAKILKDEGYIRDYEVLKDGPQRNMKIQLRYIGRKEPILHGLQRVSKPGLRVYVQKAEIPRVYGGLGMAILTTPMGVMTGQQAWRRRVGGEILCYVW